LLGFDPAGNALSAFARNGLLAAAVRRLSAALFVVRLPAVAFAMSPVQ
jgi:hypothetical protein